MMGMKEGFQNILCVLFNQHLMANVRKTIILGHCSAISTLIEVRGQIYIFSLPTCENIFYI